MCAVHDLRASDGESAPWRQDVHAAYSPAALCGAFWIHGTHILPKLAVFECMQAICCHELAFFSSRPLRERIRTTSCHGRQLGNASRRYIAVARPGGTARRQALGIGIPSARVASVVEWRDFHTRAKDRSPHRRPRNKRRRAHCSPSFVVRFTTRMTLGTCTATSRCPSAFFPTEDCARQQVCTHANRVDRQSAREDPRAH